MRAMQATRYSRQTGLMPSQASQFPPLNEVGSKVAALLFLIGAWSRCRVLGRGLFGDFWLGRHPGPSKSEPLQERAPKQPLPQQRIWTQSIKDNAPA
ncbi:hypothetical protein A7318_04730 [Pseudomonas lurida]|nr:hypothetical protein A7318_04730 [Pseudomonas lurida]